MHARNLHCKRRFSNFDGGEQINNASLVYLFYQFCVNLYENYQCYSSDIKNICIIAIHWELKCNSIELIVYVSSINDLP
jgi:hypothetical protein